MLQSNTTKFLAVTVDVECSGATALVTFALKKCAELQALCKISRFISCFICRFVVICLLLSIPCVCKLSRAQSQTQAVETVQSRVILSNEIVLDSDEGIAESQGGIGGNRVGAGQGANLDRYGEDFLQGNPLIISVPKAAAVTPTPEARTHSAEPARAEQGAVQLSKQRDNTVRDKSVNTELLNTEPVNAEPVNAEPVTVRWLRKNYPLLEERAIDNPSTPNIEAYLYAKRIILDKAQNFSTKVEEVTKADPFLNENNRIPYASSGATSIRNANIAAQKAALKHMALLGGVYLFVDGHCIFCAQQIPVMSFLKEGYGLETWVISVDGTVPYGYTGQIATDNGLYKKLGLKLTPSIVFVNEPKAYTNGLDTNQYLIIAQGYYAADELTKVMAYAAYHTDLLSADIKKDLNLWDRGVGAAEDLSRLTLDVNRPESFKQRLQPILERRY